jgi:3-isopropylmalate dehydratase small subunit
MTMNKAHSPANTNRILKGKAWSFGDNINTDIIIPFRFKSRTNDPHEMAKYAMYGLDADFHKKISKGDIIVAGRNFGGGSSREQAPVALKYAGISAVVAQQDSLFYSRKNRRHIKLSLKNSNDFGKEY